MCTCMLMCMHIGMYMFTLMYYFLNRNKKKNSTLGGHEKPRGCFLTSKHSERDKVSPHPSPAGDVVEGPRCSHAAAATAVPSLLSLTRHKELLREHHRCYTWFKTRLLLTPPGVCHKPQFYPPVPNLGCESSEGTTASATAASVRRGTARPGGVPACTPVLVGSLPISGDG